MARCTVIISFVLKRKIYQCRCNSFGNRVAFEHISKLLESESFSFEGLFSGKLFGTNVTQHHFDKVLVAGETQCNVWNCDFFKIEAPVSIGVHNLEELFRKKQISQVLSLPLVTHFVTSDPFLLVTKLQVLANTFVHKPTQAILEVFVFNNF